MADEKPTAFTTVQPESIDDLDWIIGVDVSDTTDDATGSDAKFPAWALPKVKSLSSDATANSTTTAAKITSLDQLAGIGTFVFKYYIRYVTSVITTGVKFSVNHTGSVSTFTAFMRYVDAAATAATGAPKQNQNATTAGVMGSYSSRAISTAANMGPTLSADATSDMMIIIEGLMIVTVSGNIELYHASETAASTTVKAGSSLILHRTL